jgi:hypothetical protein
MAHSDQSMGRKMWGGGFVMATERYGTFRDAILK